MATRRPSRAAVEAAIRKSGGNLTRAAAFLDCTRQTLYVWIYQYGLERLAGVRLDEKKRQDAATGETVETVSPTVYSAKRGRGRLPRVTEDLVPATVRLPLELWRSIRARAIWLNVSASEVVREALEEALAKAAAHPGERRRRNGNGDKKRNGTGG